MNESIYRSPKFLRKFIDFEIKTGEDITGKESKADKRNQDIKNWNDKWNKIDVSNFLKFYREKYPNHSYVKNINDIRKMWFLNFDIFINYENWINDKIKKEKEQENIKNELNKIYNKIHSDFFKNPIRAKFDVEDLKDGKRSFHYTCDDGEKITINSSTYEIIYTTSIGRVTYRVNLLLISEFVTLANKIIGFSGYKNRNSEKTDTKEVDNNRRKYNLILDTIKLRKDQLNSMSKDHPDRKILERELEAAELSLKNMKNKYNFESMNYLIKYNKFNEDKDDDITDEYSDKNYSDIKSEISDMIKSSLKSEDSNVYKEFIEAYKKSPEDNQIEGLINDSDIYEFYLKWRNDIDDILSSINYYDEIPSENKVYSLYDYIISGTKKSIIEVINMIS